MENQHAEDCPRERLAEEHERGCRDAGDLFESQRPEVEPEERRDDGEVGNSSNKSRVGGDCGDGSATARYEQGQEDEKPESVADTCRGEGRLFPGDEAEEQGVEGPRDSRGNQSGNAFQPLQRACLRTATEPLQ